MATYTVQHAKTHLSRILAEVEAGGEAVIARGSQPVARVIPVQEAPPRSFGSLEFTVPDDFDAPLGDEELAAWE